MSDRKLAHMGYVVPNMDAAVRRFEREGGRLILPPTVDPLQGVTVCLFRLDGAVDVELVAPHGTGGVSLAGRLARGGGLDHICFEVDDLPLALAEEEERGALLLRAPCHAIAFDTSIAFVHRKSGLVVELMQTKAP